MKKKVIVYAIILVAITVATLIVSSITGVEPNNTWLGILFANAFFGTIVVVLFDISRAITHSHVIARITVYFAIVLLLFLIIVNNVVFLVGRFNYY